MENVLKCLIKVNEKDSIEVENGSAKMIVLSVISLPENKLKHSDWLMFAPKDTKNRWDIT